MNHTAEPVELKVEPKKPRRLTSSEREHVIHAIESAFNGGWDEVRIWPDGGRIWTIPIKSGRRQAA